MGKILVKLNGIGYAYIARIRVRDWFVSAQVSHTLSQLLGETGEGRRFVGQS